MSKPDIDGIDPEAMRYGFDGYGWLYCDNGDGGNWRTRHTDAEPLYDADGMAEAYERGRKAMQAEVVAVMRTVADTLDDTARTHWGIDNLRHDLMRGAATALRSMSQTIEDMP